jgi:hypothetical protein
MPARIVPLEKPKRLRPVKMGCDEPINAKLSNQGPLVKDLYEKTFTQLILGRAGSGKTALMTQLVGQTMRECFEWVYLIIPPSSLEDIEEHDNIFNELPEEQKYPDLTPEVLEEIYHQCIANKSLGEHSLVIVDDFQYKLKDKPIEKALQKFVISMRHVFGSVIILQQNYKSLTKKTRSNASSIITFFSSKNEMEDLFDETFKRSKQDYLDLMRCAFKKDYDWIAISTRSNKAYAKFDAIRFDDDDDVEAK